MRHDSKMNRPTFRSVIAAFAVLLAIGTITIFAQNPPLSLADLLIGLRSKKVTIEERNQILTTAVKERGVTFAMSPEIEKELAATGADANLIAAVKAKTQPVKPVAVATPAATPTPVPPDAAFFQKRADEHAEKGEFDAAFNDYSKAVEMKGDDANLYVKRGRTLVSLKSYDRSVKDFDKAIELNPKTAIAFFNRGASFEKLGDAQKALADYKKAAQLDETNEAAKAEAKRLQDQFDQEEAAKRAAEKPKVVVKPEFLNLGALSNSNAVRLVMPTYPVMARQSRVEGKVSVEVELDLEGNVVSADATSGPAMLKQAAEDAAKKSKFNPATFNGEPIKAKGVVTYNFTL
jgi:TonB family protein